MSSNPAPPPYSSLEPANDITIKDNTIIPEKPPRDMATNPAPLTNNHITNHSIEMGTLPSSSAMPNTPVPYATAPNTPAMPRQQVNMPYPAQSAPSLSNMAMNGGIAGSGGMPQCATSPQTMPQTMPMGYGGAPMMPGMPTYPGQMPMHPMYAQSAAMGMNPMQPAMNGMQPAPMGMSPPQQPAAVGTNPSQNGGINLIVNTNANSGSNSDAKGGGGNGAEARPAPRPCPKCRLGYITRGQARIREMCIKALAYATVCCTCFLPLQLLKTNYVDKCSYCGEEYGFRGELFEKPKAPKL